MFIVFLTFGENKSKAADFMAGHNDWISKGLADGCFLLVGSLQPNRGGCILAQAASKEEMEQIVALDPFVAEGVVEADIHEVSPNQATDALQFLLD